MKNIKHKLNRKGASVVLALVVFLIAALVCITIVNASILTTKRSYSDINEEKAYLAVTSAAKVLKECLGGAQYKKLAVSGNGAAVSGNAVEPTVTGIKYNGTELTDMEDLLLSLVASPGASKNLTINGVENVPPVTGTLKISNKANDYTLTAELTALIDGTENYEATVVFRSAYYIDEDPETHDKSTYISWPKDGAYIITTKVETTTNTPAP